MDFKLQKDIFWAFLRVGMLGYGGGPASIPLLYKEVVDRYQWMTDEEFGDIFAIANTLPGPIMSKMAGYIGYRLGGITALFNAVLTVVMPTVFIMIGLGGLFTYFSESTVVRGMIRAVGPVVGVMLASLAFSFFTQAKKSLGWMTSITIFILSIVAYKILDIHPALIVGVLLVYPLLRKEPAPNKPKEG